MSKHAQEAGRLLRQFRQQRQQTLKEVAPYLHRSIAALSRLERGEEAIERSDIHRIIQVFHLSAWEAHHLWLAAGFVPDEPPPHQGDLPALVETLLSKLCVPAFVIDRVGYLQGWNQEFATLWGLSQDAGRPHLLAHLFSETMRTRLGEEWRPYTRQWVAFFQRRQRCWMHDPAVRQIWDELAAIYGEVLAGSDGAMVVRHPGQGGMCAYLVVQPVLACVGRGELVVYVPVGAEEMA
jgi:transcriptional regulator with XRE-family HTH domain